MGFLSPRSAAERTRVTPPFLSGLGGKATFALALALVASAAVSATAQHHDHGTQAPVERNADAKRDSQLDAVRRATERFRDIEVARSEGFVRFGKDEGPLMGEHWYRKAGADAPAADSIDLERPGTLMYAVIGGDRVLVGVAYSVRLRPGDAMPEGFAVQGSLFTDDASRP